jgi:mRNA interferase RelE/StbE
VQKYKIVFAPSAAKQLSKFSYKLSTDPFLGKRLKGELSDYHSYRVGNYRIIYFVRKREILIEIVRVAHRREV